MSKISRLANKIKRLEVKMANTEYKLDNTKLEYNYWRAMEDDNIEWDYSNIEDGAEMMNSGTGEIGTFYTVDNKDMPYRVRIKSGGIDEFRTMEELSKYWSEIDK